MPVFERDSSNMVFNFLMGYAFLKFAQKADTLLRILGLNTASTGDMVRFLGGTIAGIAMTLRTAGGMANHVTSAIGQRFGGTGAAGKALPLVQGEPPLVVLRPLVFVPLNITLPKRSSGQLIPRQVRPRRFRP